MKTEIISRLDTLKTEMKKRNIKYYLVCSADFHGSEYVGDYFKVREFLSGFTGSAGTLLVGMEEAFLWTDGRYFLQADRQLKDTGITLMRSGTKGVPSLISFLSEHLENGDRLGFDGRTVSIQFVASLFDKCKDKQIELLIKEDLADLFWTDRPKLSDEPVWELDLKYAGESASDKMNRLKAYLRENHIDYQLITSLEEICWLLNLRGADVECTPVFLGYLLVTADRVYLYAVSDKFSTEGIIVKPYADIYEDLGKLSSDSVLSFDDSSANYLLSESISKQVKVKIQKSPVALWKAVKNETECNNIRLAHRKDGVAVTRFIHWIKEAVKNGETVTECSAAAQLECFRKEQEHYLSPSFAPIIAYGAHGAIVHYSATKETDAVFSQRGLCLADIGGHYLEGTTDITRTFSLGELTEREKRMYTLVLKGHLALSQARFKAGVCGANLDYLAREPLWREGLDYLHGTGHGVGYLLSVHEGPHRIHYGADTESARVAFEPGMIISNEPGYYETDCFGIRHENLVLVTEDRETEYGKFYRFENLTMVPFDLSAIDKELLSVQEIAWLNAYHKAVFDTLSPFMKEEELGFLKDMTAPVLT